MGHNSKMTGAWPPRSFVLPCQPPKMVDLDMEVASTARSSAPANARAAGPLLRVENLRKEYRTGRGNLLLFSGLNFTVEAGEMLAVVGQSGAGKSTLLHILGALDTPTSGDVYFDAIPLSSLSSTQSSDFRNRGRSATCGSSITSCPSSRQSKM